MFLTIASRLQFLVLLTTQAALAQTDVRQTHQEAQQSFSSIAKSPDIKAQAEIQQRSAKALVKAAAPQSNTVPITSNNQQIEREVDRQATSNRQAIEATSAQAVQNIKESLPKLNDLGNLLKLGESITVSPDGKAVIAEIRRLPGANIQEQRQGIERLAILASNRVPEALHFMGFLHETGMYSTAKNPLKASQLYEAAATKNYTPALYNHALMRVYARGLHQDSGAAITTLSAAQGAARDTSGRVCGMLSFLLVRSGSTTGAKEAAKGCNSPLANLARAQDETQPLQQRVTWLRDSIATGVDDGFVALVKITRATAKTDPNATFCKYVLVGQNFYSNKPQNWRSKATQCLDYVAKEHGPGLSLPMQREQMVQGVSGFALAEIVELKKLRQSNRFRPSLPVPYLPFTQQDVDLFESSYAAQGYK